MAVHPTSGEVLVAGYTNSTDFPGTAGGAQPNPGGGFYTDGFIARLNPTLTALLQSTYLGGSSFDSAFGIAIHPTSGEVLVAGYTYSSDFPGTIGGAQPTSGGGVADGFVARLNPSLTTLLQSSYLGGSGLDQILSIAIHPTSGEVLIAGYTDSTDLPGTSGGAQPANGGAGDVFVARLNPALTTLLQATYLGGSGADGLSYDTSVHLAVHPSSGEVLVSGYTTSTDFPGTAGGVQPSNAGGSDVFVARLDPALTLLLQATYLGGSSIEFVNGLAIHPSNGEIFVAGHTISTDFPGTAGGAQPSPRSIGGVSDGFVARLDETLTTLLQSSYFGGSNQDLRLVVSIHPSSGEVLVAGYTFSTDLSGTAGGAQPKNGGMTDAFVARFDSALTTLLQATYLGSGEYVSDFGAFITLAIHPTSGEVLVAGQTYSEQFPGAAGGAQSTFGGGENDGFIARLTPDLMAILSPVGLSVDPLPNPGDGDHILEPGETVPVAPVWQNLSATTYTPNGQASGFTGPGDSVYSIENGTVVYTTIPPSGEGIPVGAYTLSISVPSFRPGTHWDAKFTETLDTPYVLPYVWTLHVGDSFPDVPRTNLFYAFIENVLHHGITGGCGGGDYCPDSSVTRAQMAVFLLKAKHGSSHIPPPCTGIFPDVPCPSQFADWIEQLFAEGITGGCGSGNYCPNNPVTRAQMAVFLLKAEHGSSYTPPACTGIFPDVPCPSQFADWIEQLFNEAITGGCGGGKYCPNNPNTRGQMAVFLVKTFGLQLYGP